jgi:hypothetical protein
MCFLTRSFSIQQLVEPLLGAEATKGHVAGLIQSFSQGSVPVVALPLPAAP